jgi:hypothetical protein
MAMEKSKAQQQSHNMKNKATRACAKTVRIGKCGQIGKISAVKNNGAG